MVDALKEGVERAKNYILPVFDKVNSIDSCMDYLNEFKMPRSRNLCMKKWPYYPDADEGFLNFLSDRIVSERPEFLENYLNDKDFHDWILSEIEKRKKENTDILKELNLIN